MSLQFILGNSGSGKTEYVFKKIILEAKANPKKNFLIMAPEQSTIELQRKLVDLSPDQVIMNVDVLGFTRLAYRIFDELGMSALTVLDETGKNLVLRKVAQEKEESLTVLRPNLNRMGYINELKSLLSELAQYHITPERLEEALAKGNLSSVFASKIRDIQTMQKGFSDFMEEKYITQEELLQVFCKVASESEILKNSVIVFDDYTGFTPIQNQVLRVLLPLVERVEIIMTIDEKEANYRSSGIQDLFDMPKTTIDQMTLLCQELGIEKLPSVIMGGGDKKRYVKAPDLFWMEQNLFRPTYRRKMEPVNQIKLSVTRTPREEMIYVAREIHRLVREENYRYGEIAVVTGAVEAYGNYVDGIFQKYQIPYFLDVTKEIVFHPFIEFIRATLEILESNFSYESVFRFFRSGFTCFSDQEIDMLENYVLAVGIRGKSAWQKRFLRMPRNKKFIQLEEVEALRLQFMEWIEPLANAFSDKEIKVAEQVKALYLLIVSLEVENQLVEKQKEYEEIGLLAKAKEYEQIYGIVMGLFDKVVGVLGEEKLDIKEFAEIMDAGLSAASVASLPPGQDNVIIGDIERTRLNHVKVLFFIGVNDGIIPKSSNAGGIISEYERSILAKEEMVLAPGSREQVFIQKYYLYLNLTKPSEKLYLSYASVDSDGRALRPSYLVGNLKKMFPALVLEERSDLEKQLNLSTKESAMDYFIHGKQDEAWYTLAKFFMQDEARKEEVEALLSARFYHYEDEPISRAVAQAIYGRTMRGSVTRLEHFAQCAYQHFLQYGLGLTEREESGFQGLDRGNIYHDALQKYSEKLQKSDYDWFSVPDKERESLADAAMQEAIAEYPALTTYATGESSYQVERMTRILKQTIWALTEQVRRGKFSPSQFEVTFSQEDVGDFASFKLSENERLELMGRIDRLDTCEDPNHIYVKVIDYKSGNTKFDFVKIYQGLQLQLVMYMNAAKEMLSGKKDKDVIPGGIFYYNIDEPMIESDGELTEQEYKAAVLKQLCPNGSVNEEKEIYALLDEGFLEEGYTKSDVIPLKIKKDGEIDAYSNHATSEQFEMMGEYVKALIEESAEEIYNGKISVNPFGDKQKGSCSYCPYSSICGFDTRMPGFEIRKLETPAKAEVLEKMEIDLEKMKARKGSSRS